MDEEGGLEPGHMGGEGVKWFDQVVPTMDPAGGESDDLNFLQGRADNCGPSADNWGDYMGTYDVFREVQGSGLEDDYFDK